LPHGPRAKYPDATFHEPVGWAPVLPQFLKTQFLVTIVLVLVFYPVLVTAAFWLAFRTPLPSFTSTWAVTENNRRARFYRLTRAGRHQLDAETASWVRLTTAVQGVLGS